MINDSDSKVKFRKASNHCKRVLEAAKLVYVNKTLPRNLALRTFHKLLIVFSTKVNLLYLLCSMIWRCCLLHLIKQNCLLKTFLRTPILMTQVSLYLFLPRTNLKLDNISVTLKMLKKVIMNLDQSKAFGCVCIPVVVLKNSELECFHIAAELFNKCLKEFLQIVGRFHLSSLYLRMLGKGLQLKITALLAFFLWLVKSLKNL